MSAADVFSVAELPEIAEPDIIIKEPKGRRILETDIEDILVWDRKAWNVFSQAFPPVTSLENDTTSFNGGITKDNNRNDDGSPTANTVAQGTRPGGDGASTTGGVGGTQSPAVMVGEIAPRFEAFFEFLAFFAEEQSATSNIFSQEKRIPDITPAQPTQAYRVDGHTVFDLMTAAHYHAWADTDNWGAVVGQYNLGAVVRKVSIDIEEVLFDRDVLASILDVLTFSQ